MIGELSTKPVVTIATTSTVREAARLMKQKNVGAVIVINGDRPCGILTDRDIAVTVVAGGMDPATVEVGTVMHKNPAVIRDDQGIFDAVKMFDAKGVRRLPVVNADGQLSGVVALDDVLMLFGREMGHVASALSRELRRPKATALH
jgi:signal-transduction protein with cAMP-binding, CBS, and nucleotidyltransferase domain